MGWAPMRPRRWLLPGIYEAKGRPSFNPLIAHVADIKAARQIARFDATATRLAEAFWPGPLTLVLPKTADCPVADLATAGLDTVAIRVPAHPVAQAILRALAGRWWRLPPISRATSRRPPQPMWRATSRGGSI